GNTKIYKSPRPDYPPASQTLHSTVGPGSLFLFLGPAVVACEDSSVFLRHEILLQAQRCRIEGKAQDQEHDEDDELPSCVVLDWIAGGRGKEERWKANRSEWRLIVRWAELEPNSTASLQPNPDSITDVKQQNVKGEEKEEDEEEEYVDEEDPRDIADRLAGGPVVFRDGFLIEHNPSLPSKPFVSASSATSASASGSAPPGPKMTSYAPSLYPHSTIGSLFIMGPKTARLQRSILRRFEQLTVYPGQKPDQRADYPILWSVTVVQVPRPAGPNQGPPSPGSSKKGSVPRRKLEKMNAMVVKMASQGNEQMQDFIKSLFEEQAAEMDNRKKMMDSDDEDDHDRAHDRRGAKNGMSGLDNRPEEELSVIEELFGGRTVWERVFR
ncbi:hypothetical protein BGZ54_005694, partial [Gamsiella multidivaricata]